MDQMRTEQNADYRKAKVDLELGLSWSAEGSRVLDENANQELLKSVKAAKDAELAAHVRIAKRRFKDYSKNKQASGVQGMIQSIIDDAKVMENEAIVDEENLL
jgi:hypothetical protein